MCILKPWTPFLSSPPCTHQQITTLHTKQILSRSKLLFSVEQKIFHFLIDIQLFLVFSIFQLLVLYELLKLILLFKVVWSFAPCHKSLLWMLELLWARWPASSCGLQRASYQLALGENLLLLIFFSHFGFLGTCACKYLLFMLLCFLVVATLGLSQCSLAWQKRDIQRDYQRENISSWKVTSAHPEVFESCACRHKRLCAEAAYTPTSVCRSVSISLIISDYSFCFLLNTKCLLLTMKLVVKPQQRGRQPENPSKTGKLPHFSFDFTGDFNRKIGAILKPEKLQDLWGSHRMATSLHPVKSIFCSQMV